MCHFVPLYCHVRYPKPSCKSPVCPSVFQLNLFHLLLQCCLIIQSLSTTDSFLLWNISASMILPCNRAVVAHPQRVLMVARVTSKFLAMISISQKVTSPSLANAVIMPTAAILSLLVKFLLFEILAVVMVVELLFQKAFGKSYVALKFYPPFELAGDGDLAPASKNRSFK